MSENYSAHWYCALSLHERIALSGEPISTDIALGQRRLQAWREQAALEEPDFFAGYLRSLDISEQQFIQLLGESNDSLRERAQQVPDWLQQLHHYYSVDAELPELSDAFRQNWEEHLLLTITAPILAEIHQQLQEEIEQLLVGVKYPPFDPVWILQQYFEQFSIWVLWLLLRPMILELNISRLQQEFPGETSAQRFQAFIDHYSYSKNALELLKQYPVMARKLVEQVPIFKRANTPFLKRLINDYQELSKKFFAGQELGKITAIQLNLSDPHRGGKRVFKVKFANGQQIIYKPKSLAVDQCYQQLLTFINDNNPPLPFRTIQVWDRGAYGWVECVLLEACKNKAELDRFYQRQGINMALLYALNANDFHYENLIAAGDHPVLIDLETLCQPRVTDVSVSKVHIDLLNSTVLAIGLLPYENGIDDNLKQEVGGLGGAAGQTLTIRKITGVNTDEMQVELEQFASNAAENLPTLEGESINFQSMTEPVVKGFEAMYDWLISHRDNLLTEQGPLADFADVEIRMILRNTIKYTALQNACWHPDIVQNALFKDRLLAKLWRQGHRSSLYLRACPYEIRDLENGDIPLFSTYVASHDLKAGEGEWLPDVLNYSGQQAVTNRLQNMDAIDKQRQTWLIRGALDIRRPPQEPNKDRWKTSLPEIPDSQLDRQEYLNLYW